MGSKGGGSSQPSGTTTSTQTSTPWAAQQPFLEGGTGIGGQNIPGLPNGGGEFFAPGLMDSAAQLYMQYQPQYFPQSTVAGFNPTQQAGLGAETMFGLGGGSSSVNAANSALTNIESGNLLSAGNPYFQATANAIGQGLAPTINSQFEANGRYGSGSNVQAMSSALANAIAPLANQNYTSGINNMLQGAIAAPAVQSGQQAGYQALQDAGNQQQTQTQNQLNDQVNRWNYQQNLPYNQLQAYQQGVTGNYGGTSALTQPYFSQGGKKGGSGGGDNTASQVMQGVGTAAKVASLFAA